MYIIYEKKFLYCNIYLIFVGNSNSLKQLLHNKHLRQFLNEIDTAPNAWRAMQTAMMEPLFIEFADECLQIVETKT